ncbi:hypothetical protein D8674_023744 [Pyrus ussuriensis x Pyrus communis]|uniref:RNase H type-1 domain-containing protein n=1 Tax=Pyrus ussuriensis x Pyrus communis TaxID=2448454 RepID=A0A5N5H635_9ROSA|nr:hypothetical protein D8674_023744 [Pyrus ussuriensis x Pyrus communis]
MEGDAFMVVASNQKDTSANFSHFYKREANKVAHHLARFSLTSILDATWFEDPPDIILYVLVEDKI